jgi:hypothetical protein
MTALQPSAVDTKSCAVPVQRRPLVEDQVALDIRWLAVSVRRSSGAPSIVDMRPCVASGLLPTPAGSVAAQWTLGGRSGSGHAVLEEPSGRLHTVSLVSTPQPFGGLRWWWQCPECLTRAGVLYLVAESAQRTAPMVVNRWPQFPAGARPRCRSCSGLRYQSTVVGDRTRAYIVARRRRDRLRLRVCELERRTCPLPGSRLERRLIAATVDTAEAWRLLVASVLTRRGRSRRLGAARQRSYPSG